ncbi:hypothetical protein ACLMJK_003398 [Lecanora helva]
MYYLSSLLSFLLLPSPLTHAATPEQNRQGRWNGTLPSFYDWFGGDFLTESRCECYYDFHGAVQGFVYQWEYYNYHLNQSFINTYQDKDGPMRFRDLGIYFWWCSFFAIEENEEAPKGREFDKLCIWPNSNVRRWLTWEDVLQWNEQKRGLSKYGEQGLKVLFDGEGGYCDDMCSMFMEAEKGLKGTRGKGTYKFWEKLDDMCDNCR